ncbi:CU044_5270 family protein [Amycolatopsis sp. QT-25]|uniref:CU044_5270 family protein n=1 Tax=Amycolatopsis sp. QT-25 TaxID=3034022 RepID=UPI0023EC8FE2|nr:CU044_5270 family protein [Amycolatopsis sp. QT-25]WET78977.1 CU044_5270 family protein [Amycolatopsis sp. QT-25]
MNDLDVLRTALVCDEPPQEVIDRSRHRLQNHLRGASTPRKRIGWLVAGSGTAVAAAVAAVLVLVPGPQAGGPPLAESPDPAAARTVAGQEILLAAAAVAERTPEGTGTYWHVHVTLPEVTYETWVKTDGSRWFRGAKSGNRVIAVVKPNQEKPVSPFSLVGVDLTLEQLRGLPTNPDALTAWIAEALTHSTARTSAGPFTAADREYAAFLSLISLASTLPAPPAVRAAAFRALATYPGVQNLGDQGLLLPDGLRFAVDPATGRVNGTSSFVDMDGALYKVVDSPGAKITAEWVNDLPA